MVWVGRAWFLVTVFCIQGCATGGKEPVRSTGMLWFGLQPCQYKRWQKDLRSPVTNFSLTMAVHTILKMGDPRLFRAVRPVTEFGTDALRQLVADMHDTMRAAMGAGLAAPQIGVDRQVVVFGSDVPNPRYPDRPLVPATVLINPVITPVGDEEALDWEGCLSVPGLRGRVPRWSHIRYTGYDMQGNAIERDVDGFHARVVQHECDHLAGILYPMRMRDFTQFGFTEVLCPEMDPGLDD